MKRNNKNKKKISKETIVKRHILQHLVNITQHWGNIINVNRIAIDINDGLKPGARRLLYSAYEMKLINRLTKLSQLVGYTMGNYYPHGDGGLTSTVNKITRSWEIAYPYLKGAGNFGNITGHDSSAMRYLEIKLDEFAYDCYFTEINKIPEVTNYKDNYLRDSREPLVLPAKYPVALLNSSLGIGYGLQSCTPSYNLNEIFNLAIKLIEDEDYLPKKPLIPDSCSNILISGIEGIRNIWETGEGTYWERGIMEIDDNNNIIIKSIPSRTNVTKILDKIKTLVNDNKLSGLSDFHNNSTKENVNVILEVKSGYSARKIMELLYKKTDLEKFTHIKMKCVTDFKTKLFTPILALRYWIDFRRSTKFRYYNNIRHKIVTDKYMLEAKIDIIENPDSDSLLKEIKQSEDNESIRIKLQNRYPNLLPSQINIIIRMGIQQFSKKALRNYKADLEEMIHSMEYYDRMLTDIANIDNEIISELKEGMRKYGRKRRASFVKEFNDSYVSNLDHMITLSNLGYIKKLPKFSNKFGHMKKGDVVNKSLLINNRETSYIFDTKGRIYKLDINDIPESNIKGGDIGTHISDIIKIKGALINMIPRSQVNDESLVLTVTKLGLISLTNLEEFESLSSRGLAIMKLNNIDEMIFGDIIKSHNTLLLYTNKGRYLSFSTTELEPTGRMSKGSNGIRLDVDEHVIGVIYLRPNTESLLVVTENGLMKRVDINNIITTKRYHNSNRVLCKLSDDDSLVKVMILTNKHKELSLQTSGKNYNFNKNDIPVESTISKGKNILSIGKRESIGEIK